MNSPIRKTVAEIRAEADKTYTLGLAVMSRHRDPLVLRLYADHAKLSSRFLQVPKSGGIAMYVNVVNQKGRVVRQFPMFDGNLVIPEDSTWLAQGKE